MGLLLVFGLNEGLVECARLCVKNEVILKLLYLPKLEGPLVPLATSVPPALDMR